MRDEERVACADARLMVFWQVESIEMLPGSGWQKKGTSEAR